MNEREYIRFAVVGIHEGDLQQVHAGMLPYHSDANRILEAMHGVRLAVVPEAVMNAIEDFNAESICSECMGEKLLLEDHRGTYWYCPSCDEEKS